jgi:hypothetical protein
MAKRGKVLISRESIPAWLLVSWAILVFILEWIGNYDTVMGHIGQMKLMFNFLATPIGGAVLMVIGFLWLGWLVLRHPPVPATGPHTVAVFTQLRVLERFYISLAGMKDHARMLKDMAELGRPQFTGFIDLGIALEKVRNELIDLAPTVFPSSTALDFKDKAPLPEGSLGISDDRVPIQIEELMQKVRSHWSRYAEEAGIAPMKFGEKPVVKITP